MCTGKLANTMSTALPIFAPHMSHCGRGGKSSSSEERPAAASPQKDAPIGGDTPGQQRRAPQQKISDEGIDKKQNIHIDHTAHAAAPSSPSVVHPERKTCQTKGARVAGFVCGLVAWAVSAS